MPIDVEIKDFQSLKLAKLRIEKFTVLIGRNNLGKSSVTRAIRSVAKNIGDATRIGSKFNEVTLSEDSFKVVRKKGPNHNDYHITDADQKVSEYLKVNRDVPSEIADLGFKSIQVGRDKVFVQFPNQFEKIFLLDRPGSVIAEVLSKISNIEVINQALRLANGDRKKKESLLKVRRVDLESAKQRLTHFDRLAELNDLSSKVKELDEQKHNIEGILAQLALDVSKIKEHRDRILKLSPVSSIDLPEVDFELFDHFDSLRKDFYALASSTRRFNNLKRLKEVDLPKFSGIIILLEDLVFAQDKLSIFEQQTSSVETTKKGLDVLVQESKELALEKEEIKQTEECPFKDIFSCNQVW